MLGWKEKTPDGCNSTMQLISLMLSTLREDKAWQSEHPEWTAPGQLEELVRDELLVCSQSGRRKLTIFEEIISAPSLGSHQRAIQSVQ